ncbi:MAG: N-acetylglutaminylglutamine amidotransferase [Opitutales bacterium]|nr:N-acetylglutaminylglutamine amidotransferase [Opitutales bacterium]
MCGICGEFAFGDRSANVGAVERMNACMTRRGPDGAGMVVRNHVALGHRRLKIIDLSEAAQQPMVDSDLGLSIAYNGAIYNYRELRSELQSKGYRFFSNGDTEVILKAYHAWGLGFVERLNGMFAFAIYERDSGKLIIGRDRVGIKPFYYSRTQNEFRFASSLPAVLKSGGVDTSIDPVALNYYLSFHAVVPAPYTIVKGVRKLPPATIAVVEPNGRMTEHNYWKLEYGTPGERAGWSEDDWKAATLDVLRRSVKRRLVADVPVGVLLSGGLDSSLIVGLLAEQGAAGLETFSIGFETVRDEKGDEFQYSDIIAKRFDTSHHKLFVDSTKALPALIECIGQMAEPMVSHDNVGFFMLSQEVAKFVKVVQSGQGADEIFGGYHWYPPMLESQNAVADYLRVFRDRDFEEYKQTVQSKWVEKDYSAELVQNHFNMPGATRPVDQTLRIDSLIMLVDDPVKRVDSNTMAASLEARVPFLDHEVLEFAATMPAELKIRDGGKYILAEAAREVIPHDVIDRPKGYFPMPSLKYLRGEFLDFAKSSLLNDAARERGLFQPDYVEKLLKDPEKHITPLQGSKLWQLSLLEHWLQTHI